MARALPCPVITVILVILLIARFGVVQAHSFEAPSAWFGPNNETPDLIDLFKQPEQWAAARKSVKVFQLAGQQASSNNVFKLNNYPDLVAAHAFQLLQLWHLPLALETGAIKEWDCSGKNAALQTVRLLANVRKAGGHVQYIAMDEPLVSAVRACKLATTDAVTRTADYINAVRAADVMGPGDAPIHVGDVEPYPFFRVPDIEKWIDALQEAHGKLDFFHLDINVQAVNVQSKIDMGQDVKTLYAFAKARQIPFGIIFWSGYNPLNSDRSYFNYTMEFLERIHQAIGQPDHAVFESWITRSPLSCSTSNEFCAKAPCTSADPPYCDAKSIPVNLPDNQPNVFSHTRLILEGLHALEH